MGSFLINSDGTNHKLNYNGSAFKLNYTEYFNGLVGLRYIGYHDDDPAWFSTATPHGDGNVLLSIDNFSSSPDFAEQEYYSWEWVGFFKAPFTEEYTFYTYSDDGSYLWIGESANNPTLLNVLVNNGGAHGPQEAFGSVNLVADTYYPIRIQFGEIGGGDIMTVSFSSNSVPKTTNGNGYYFHA